MVVDTIESIKEHNQSLMDCIKEQNLVMLETLKNHSVSITETWKDFKTETFQNLTDQAKATHDVLNAYVNKTDTVLEWINELKDKTLLDPNSSLESNTSQFKRSFAESEINEEISHNTSKKVL